MLNIFNNFDRVVKRLLLVLAIIIIFLSFSSPVFLSKDNMLSITRTLPILGIICAGELIIIVMGQFDLSVGAIASLTGVIIGFLDAHFALHIFPATLIALFFACIIGYINGVLVTKLKINSFITTLGMLTICRGIALAMTRGQSNQLNYPGFLWIGRGTIFKIIPIPLLLMIITYLIIYFILNFTHIGRCFYAIGDNNQASEYIGIKIQKYERLGFLISAFLSGVAGVIMASSLGASLPNAAQGMEMTAISAVVLGGAALGGGTGSLFGVLLGVVLMRIINNGLVLLDVSSYYQNVVNGLVLLIAVGVNRITILLNRDKEGVNV